jgi:hypothetical protein
MERGTDGGILREKPDPSNASGRVSVTRAVYALGASPDAHTTVWSLPVTHSTKNDEHAFGFFRGR